MCLVDMVFCMVGHILWVVRLHSVALARLSLDYLTLCHLPAMSISTHLHAYVLHAHTHPRSHLHSTDDWKIFQFKCLSSHCKRTSSASHQLNFTPRSGHSNGNAHIPTIAQSKWKIVFNGFYFAFKPKNICKRKRKRKSITHQKPLRLNVAHTVNRMTTNATTMTLTMYNTMLSRHCWPCSINRNRNRNSISIRAQHQHQTRPKCLALRECE